MAQATQLDATEQDTLVKQIGLALLRAAPRDWQHVTVEYRALGRYHELTGEVTLSDGSQTEWVATHDIATLFGRLRTGMYRDDRGTWFNARYQLDHPSSYNLEYDREEPDWDIAPPGQAYIDELHMFPRSEENVPEWLTHRMSGLSQEPAATRLRTARIFDGTDATGRPVIDRAELDMEQQDMLLRYLDDAPVVVPSRGYDIDRFTGSQESRVPVAFHSDGTWIWPAAVNYYLREYGVSPEPELVEHIHANEFVVPEVSNAQRQAAVAHLNQGTAPAPQQPPADGASQPPPESPRQETQQHRQPPAPPQQPPEPREEPQPQQRHEHPALQQTAPETLFTPNPSFDPGPETAVTATVDEEPHENEPAADPEPLAAQHSADAQDTEAVLERLRIMLRDLRVDDSAYRIGVPAEYAWSLEETESGWRVGWYDERLTNAAMFGDVADAAAFMLGKLLLTAEQQRVQPNSQHAAVPTGPARDQQQQPAPPHPAPPAPSQPVPQQPAAPPEPPQPPQPQQSRQQAPAAVPTHAESGNNDTSPASAQQPTQAPSQQWPIQPLAGEPPLTLFRGKELRELPAGSELDRFGGPNGNLTYAAGTPFEERSLVPDWVNRPYHVYRVQRPLETLSGTAIPWFNQPGGGAAYLLPDSIENHVAEGDLIELEAGEPPVD